MKRFENIKRVDENGNVFWSARDFMLVLEYSKWDGFMSVINKAKFCCEEQGEKIEKHFPFDAKTIKIGIATRKITDYRLTKYACILILENADKRKPMVLLGKKYFCEN